MFLARKVYVEVVARFDREGNLMPLSVVWEDGRTFEIDRVLDARRAASTKAGGVGMRYLCRIQGRETYLYFEDPCWFVEGKE